MFDGLGELPFYNEDIDSDRTHPPSVVALRAAAAEADAALVVTPEYNGSIPGVLKNAIDWLSRPFGNGALKGKPLAVIGGVHSASTAGCGRTTRPASRSASPGPRVVEDLKLSVPFKSLDGKHPRENAEVAGAACATSSASWPPRSADLTSAVRAAGRLDRDRSAALLLRAGRDDRGADRLSVPRW